MRVAIMQPNFIPWLGYFKLMQSVDLFIFLDDVEYSKNSWHNRNKIFLRDSTIYTWTLPVSIPHRTSKFNEVYVNQNSLKLKKIKGLVDQNFKKKTNYKIFEEIYSTISTIDNKLSDVNIKVIKIMMKYLQLDVPTVRSSDMISSGKRSEKLLTLLNSVGATTYVAVQGAKDYMLLDDFTGKFGHHVEFFNFSCTYSSAKTGQIGENLSALNYILDV